MVAKEKKKGSSDLAIREEKMQAVILSDSYQPSFMPLTIDSPRCLMPLANTPLIEYTLECLATAGVGSVYVYCCAHAELVEEYITSSKWSSPESPFKVETIKIPESLSVGDAMRDLDSKGLIKNDFLLISGDVVGNIDLKKVIKQHKDRKNKDKNAIMTMVLREACALHRTRPRSHPGIFVLDQENGRCLRYEEANSRGGRMIGGRVAIDADLLNEVNNISFRNDMIDCHIDICSIDVPALFQENFDYDHLRSDFVRGILTSDLLGKTIYTHIVDDNGYAARVESPQTYDAVSRDVIARYTYPICPDTNLIEDHKYSYQRGHIYKETGVVLSQSAIIGGGSVIGSQTFIGSGTKVDYSVVGRRCKIGEGVTLNGAYIWDDVVIEDGAVIEKAIVANGAVIKKNAHVEPSAIISYGVVVGEGKTVPAGYKLTRSERKLVIDSEDDSDDSDSHDEVTSSRRSIAASAASIVGEDGEGYVFHGSDMDDDDTSFDGTAVDGLVYHMDNLEMSDSSLDSIQTHGARQKRGHHRTLSTTSAASGASGVSDENDVEDFFREAVASTERSIMDNHTQDIALLELNTLRMTMNAPHEKLRSAVIHALISHIARMITTGTMDAKQAAEQLFTKWTTVLRRIVHDDDDEVALLLDIQNECTRRPQGSKILFYAASTLYDNDITKEDNIYGWWNSEESKKTEALRTTRELTGRWVEWLQNAEEESEDESD